MIRILSALMVGLALTGVSQANTNYLPDLTRLGTATGVKQHGWLHLTLKGSPSNIGYQYGYLAAAEIDDTIHAVSLYLKHESGKPWNWYRETAQKMFWPKLDPEYQQEIQGIADGMKDQGYKEDAEDILADNSWLELDWYYLPYLKDQERAEKISMAPDCCSAFVATGSYTKDGKVVMGHNAWIDYIVGERWNLILDVTPEKGEHYVMDALPGFIDSGDDFGVNSAGVMETETTIAGFDDFDPNGVPEFERAIKALQYSASIDDFAKIMETGNNGGYANTWLVADSKTNEIGQLELGLKVVTFQKSKDGYFVGSNFPQNPKLIKQECTYDPNSNVNSCSTRKQRWIQLMTENKGKIDAQMGMTFEGDDYDVVHHVEASSELTICNHGDTHAPGNFMPSPFGTADAKVMTSDTASRLTFWARMGFPDGGTFDASAFLKANPMYEWEAPYLLSIPAHEWFLASPVTGTAPASAATPQIK